MAFLLTKLLKLSLRCPGFYWLLWLTLWRKGQGRDGGRKRRGFLEEKLKEVNPCKPHTGHLDPCQISGTALPSNTLLAALSCSETKSTNSFFQSNNIEERPNICPSLLSFLWFVFCKSMKARNFGQISGDPVILLSVKGFTQMDICWSHNPQIKTFTNAVFFAKEITRNFLGGNNSGGGYPFPPLKTISLTQDSRP